MVHEPECQVDSLLVLLSDSQLTPGSASVCFSQHRRLAVRLSPLENEGRLVERRARNQLELAVLAAHCRVRVLKPKPGLRPYRRIEATSEHKGPSSSLADGVCLAMER